MGGRGREKEPDFFRDFGDPYLTGAGRLPASRGLYRCSGPGGRFLDGGPIFPDVHPFGFLCSCLLTSVQPSLIKRCDILGLFYFIGKKTSKLWR